ncbi:MAG: ATP-binding cassette domain-containing protein [Propionicimonas sp.]|uniref:methionine ABC transporter ATP-binding protein n=1 Tax=Propionicimonas sp. TaxID=1955623 RepID=UPI002B21FED6|nr:ATP-binding cassette domain-containing protein [Propionicimonas sp.]MEA4944559.1 ATP-binding cassette domain-containing protein [Propionicimonas sp.]MEA5052354.1 ATP-binding cassette domain-containing protein [Propionicimonas sp.]
MITVTDLKKVYYQAKREIRALDGVTLSVASDTVHGIIGQSGAGKSTLVRCLALLDRPTSGSVEINGVELTAVHAAELRRARRRLGVVFQQANLFDSRTIAGNVAYPLELARVPAAERAAKAAELLRLVGLGDAGDAYPSQLSGGQRQRVGIARALATDPDVLLCDEPTSALDPATTNEILDLIGTIKARLGLAVLVITHEMHVVKRICDAVSLLDQGRVLESGTLVETVGRFGSRLSDALLALPPHDPAETAGGSLVEVLYTTSPDTPPKLTAAERHFGIDLPVVAGTIEHLAGTTFHRARVRVPSGTDPVQVVGFLTEVGASASLSGQETVR